MLLRTRVEISSEREREVGAENLQIRNQINLTRKRIDWKLTLQQQLHAPVSGNHSRHSK